MSRVMFDSTTVEDLPDGGDLYLGYVDGSTRNVNEVRARFPDKRVVSITVLGGNTRADGCDCETGDLTPASAYRWVMDRRGEGLWPFIYLVYGDWATCRQYFVNDGAPEPPWVIALYDNIADLTYGMIGSRRVDLTGCTAKQYANETYTGGHFDRSIVADHWAGVDQAQPTEELLMLATVHATPTGVTVPIGGLAGDTPVAGGNRRSVSATVVGQDVWQGPAPDGLLYVYSAPAGDVDVTFV